MEALLPVSFDRPDVLPADWRRTTEDSTEEWIRSDNRVCMRREPRGWAVYVRAEQSPTWDNPQLAYTVSPDGFWPPIGDPHTHRREAAWWAGMILKPLETPLPAPSWAPLP